ncbi:hypothetical protein GCM10027589_50790 [Actinocorallia lasiicapitis]
MSAPAFETPDAQEPAEASGEPFSELVPQDPADDKHEDQAATYATLAAGLLIVGTLLPWLSVTFFTSSTLTGVRLAEGKWTLLFAFLAGLFALTATVLPDRRRSLLQGTLLAGALALVPVLVYPFRYRNALDLSTLSSNNQVQKVAAAGVGIEGGWYLSLVAAALLVLAAAWGLFGRQVKERSTG